MIRFFLFLLLTAHTVLTAPISDVVFSPDGTVLASTGYQSIQLRSPADASLRETIPCEFPRVSTLAFHPSKNLLAAGGGTPGVSGTAILLDLQNRTVVRKLNGFDDLITDLTISPDGSMLAVASVDHRATIYSLDSSAAPPVKLTGHSGPVLAIAFSPQSDLVATTSADRSVKIWTTTGKLVRSFNHHTEVVHAIAFYPGARQLPECASASADQTVRIWQPSIGRMVRIVRNHDEPIFSLAYAPDGSALYSSGKTGVIRQLDTESDEILKSWIGHAEPIYSMAVSPDNRTLATGDWEGVVKVWSIPLK